MLSSCPRILKAGTWCSADLRTFSSDSGTMEKLAGFGFTEARDARHYTRAKREGRTQLRAVADRRHTELQVHDAVRGRIAHEHAAAIGGLGEVFAHFIRLRAAHPRQQHRARLPQLPDPPTATSLPSVRSGRS